MPDEFLSDFVALNRRLGGDPLLSQGSGGNTSVKTTLPDDLGFIIGLEDDYLLAEEGQYGSVSAILTQLLDDLSRFRSTNTEQDVSPNA